ncbi:DNA methylase [Salmonella phage 21]|nr:DNA methylase [Salmonella phage 21]
MQLRSERLLIVVPSELTNLDRVVLHIRSHTEELYINHPVDLQVVDFDTVFTYGGSMIRSPRDPCTVL